MTMTMTNPDAEHETIVQTGLCTCCEEPRPIHRTIGMVSDADTINPEYAAPSFVPDWDSNQEWEHDDDAMLAETVHVHKDSTSSCCDGRFDHSVVILPTHFDVGRADTMDSLRFWWGVIERSIPSHVDEGYVANIEIRSDSVRWNRPHDEGGESGELRLCRDVYCAHDESTQRDHRAEAAGY
jgi:hypothetical protein